MSPVQRSSTFLAPRTSFLEDNFSTHGGGVEVDGMTQVHYLYCTLYFYYYYIGSISDHQALDPRVWEPLQYIVLCGVLEKPTQPPKFFHYVILSEILSLEFLWITKNPWEGISTPERFTSISFRTTPISPKELANNGSRR